MASGAPRLTTPIDDPGIDATGIDAGTLAMPEATGRRRRAEAFAFNPFQIDWNDCTTGQWEILLAACKRPTLLQTWQYGVALGKTTGARADFGVIRFNGKPIGLVQVQLKPIYKQIAAARIHRGPLWIHDEIPGEMQKIVLRMLRQRYRLRRGKFMMFHPEMRDTAAHRKQMNAAGFVRRADGYASIWLDLSRPVAELRAGLQATWRNKLSQAERHGLHLQFATDGKYLDWLLAAYEDDRAERGYPGPTAAFMRQLAAIGRDAAMVQVGRAVHQGRPVAGIMVVRHGGAATYQIGWTDADGRRLGAHNLLLWRAVERLQADGFRWFDLGGTNTDGAAAIARFKQGMGGEAFTLVGGYI